MSRDFSQKAVIIAGGTVGFRRSVGVAFLAYGASLPVSGDT